MAIRYLTFEDNPWWLFRLWGALKHSKSRIYCINIVFYATLFNRSNRKQNIVEKGAILYRDIILNHPFMNGNKRAGTICLLTFLRCNGFYLDLNNEDIKTFTVETAKGNNDLDSIKLFIERYIKKIYKSLFFLFKYTL